MTALDFHFEGGAVYLPGLRLWLDAHRAMGPADAVFVSHAHSDHTAAHARVLFSPPTQKLMRARVGGERAEHVLEFGRSYTAKEAGLGDLDARITLLPAGHILGSAMIHIESGGASLLYTGDFKLRAGLSAEPCAPRAADLLIMETTYGRPAYAFPPTAEILERIIRFCVEALDHDETPVLLGYSLGKAQEILSGLAGAGLPIALGEPVAKLTAVYEALGRSFPPHEVLDLERAGGKVVLAPPGMGVSRLRRHLGACRIAVLTGWAVDPGCRFRYQADAAFPLSDHADFPDLVAFVQKVRPRSVFTLHGFAADFAAHLRALGFAARALSEAEQLELGLSGTGIVVPASLAPLLPKAEPRTSAPACEPAPPERFAAFAQACEAIRNTRAKTEKTRRLAAFLARVPPDALAAVTSWASGGPLTATGRPVSAGGAILRQAIVRAAGISDADFRAWHLRHDDIGDAAAALLDPRSDAGATPMTWTDVATLWHDLAEASNTLEKVDLLTRALARCRGDEVRCLTKILTGTLRIGLHQGLVEEAVALAFDAEPAAVREAHQLTGHLGEAAALARDRQLTAADLVPFRPVKLMLASPTPTPAASVFGTRPESQTAMAESAAEGRMEDPHERIRCQLHRVGSRVALFSRDLKDITEAFPEIAEAARRLTRDVILDGELVAMERGRARPFGHLQRRLERREPDLFVPADVPVMLVAFDLLWQSGTGLLRRPPSERRALLESLGLELPFHLAPDGQAGWASFAPMA